MQTDWVPGGFEAPRAIWAAPEARSRANRVPGITPGIKGLSEPGPRAPVGLNREGESLAAPGEGGGGVHSDPSEAQAKWAQEPIEVPLH